MFEKILYFGTGRDIMMIFDFPETKNFVFHDIMPKVPPDPHPLMEKDYWLMIFIELKEIIEKLGLYYKYDENKQCMQIFNGETQKITYYFSIYLPDDLDKNIEFIEDIKTCDTLFVSGYYPHIDVLKYIKQPFNIILSSGTFYPKDTYDNTLLIKETIFYDVLIKPEIIKLYYAFDHYNGNLYSFTSYNDVHLKICMCTQKNNEFQKKIREIFETDCKDYADDAFVHYMHKYKYYDRIERNKYYERFCSMTNM